VDYKTSIVYKYNNIMWTAGTSIVYKYNNIEWTTGLLSYINITTLRGLQDFNHV